MNTETQGKPALLGGTPALREPLPPPHNVGEEEVAATARVLRGGPLSGFVGVAGDKFYGGAEVRRFEERFARYFGDGNQRAGGQRPRA